MPEFTRDLEELVCHFTTKKINLIRNLEKNYRENIHYTRSQLKVVNETKEYGAGAVLERLIIPVSMLNSAKKIHSKYAQSTDWTKDVVRKVFG